MEVTEPVCLILLAVWSAVDLLERAGHFQAGGGSSVLKLGYQLAVCVVSGLILSVVLYFVTHYSIAVSVACGTLVVSFLGVCAGFVFDKPFTTAPWLKSAAPLLTFFAPIILLIECVMAARHIGGS